MNPVWPNEPTGNSSPRLLEKGDSMSQPSPRSADGDVTGRTEESRMPCDTAHATRGRIVDKAPEHDAMIVLCGCDTAAPSCRREILHVLHPQRLRQVSLLVLIECET